MRIHKQLKKQLSPGRSPGIGLLCFRRATLFISIVQLFENSFQLLRDGKTEVRCIFEDTQAVIRQGPEDDCSTKYAGLVQNMHIQDVRNTNQHKSNHLPT